MGRDVKTVLSSKGQQIYESAHELERIRLAKAAPDAPRPDLEGHDAGPVAGHRTGIRAIPTGGRVAQWGAANGGHLAGLELRPAVTKIGASPEGGQRIGVLRPRKLETPFGLSNFFAINLLLLCNFFREPIHRSKPSPP